MTTIDVRGKTKKEGFWGRSFGDRDLIDVDDIVDETIVIEGFDKREGTFGEYISVYINENRVVNTGSVDLIAKIVPREDRLPAEAVIRRKSLPGGRRMYNIETPEEAPEGASQV